jgi:15-cis-phytoene synthase
MSESINDSLMNDPLYYDKVAKSYEDCWNIMVYHSKSFSFANKFLNTEQRLSVSALYAFARYVDNLVDDKILPIWVVNDKLDELKSILTNISSEDKEENPIFYALDDTIQKFDIPIKYLYDLIEGVRMDLNITEFQTMKQLDLYCYRVASVIGIISCHIFGVTNSVALGHASELGIAMQITNILRDINEDFQRGRIYLPKELRDKYGVSVLDLASENVSVNLKNLIKAEINRARRLYANGSRGYQYLPNNALFTVKLAADVYSEILTEIEKMNYEVLQSRAFVSKSKKLKIASKLRLVYFFQTLPLVGRKEIKGS